MTAAATPDPTRPDRGTDQPAGDPATDRPQTSTGSAMDRPDADEPDQATPPTAGADAQPDEGPADRDRDANSEAARYRRRLRDTETERDGLRSRLERLQRAEVERLASEHLAAPGDLWALGTQLGDVLDADGEVEPDRVRDAARGLVRDRPGLAAATKAARGGAAMGQGRTRIQAPRSRSAWSDLLGQR